MRRDLTRLRPDNGNFWMSLANLLKKRGDRAGADAATEKGFAAYRKAIRQKPDPTDSYMELGDALKSLGKKEEAVAV